MARYCTQCGSEVGEKARFCTQCGSGLDAQAAPVDEAPIAAAVEVIAADEAPANVEALTGAEPPAPEEASRTFRVPLFDGAKASFKEALDSSKQKSRRRMPVLALVAIAMMMAATLAWAIYCLATAEQAGEGPDDIPGRAPIEQPAEPEPEPEAAPESEASISPAPRAQQQTPAPEHPQPNQSDLLEGDGAELVIDQPEETYYLYIRGRKWDHENHLPGVDPGHSGSECYDDAVYHGLTESEAAAIIADWESRYPYIEECNLRPE